MVCHFNLICSYFYLSCYTLNDSTVLCEKNNNSKYLSKVCVRFKCKSTLDVLPCF